jgi:hypothetical protein
VNNSRIKLGYADWTAFHPDNDAEQLYFVTVDFEQKTANYQHKCSADYQENFVLRTASETTKVIKSIRDLLSNDSWAKHYQFEDITDLRKNIIEKLITTNQSLLEIKRQLPPNL